MAHLVFGKKLNLFLENFNADLQIWPLFKMAKIF